MFGNNENAPAAALQVGVRIEDLLDWRQKWLELDDARVVISVGINEQKALSISSDGTFGLTGEDVQRPGKVEFYQGMQLSIESMLMHMV